MTDFEQLIVDGFREVRERLQAVESEVGRLADELAADRLERAREEKRHLGSVPPLSAAGGGPF